MSIIDEPKRVSARSPAAKVTQDIPESKEFWVGYVVRPGDGGWRDRRVRIPGHIVEMFATDTPHNPDRRELVLTKIVDDLGSPKLATRTDWGTASFKVERPGDNREMVEMLDHVRIDSKGHPLNVYRKVPKEAYDALPDIEKEEHPLKKVVK